jgi:hypothetical protein
MFMPISPSMMSTITAVMTHITACRIFHCSVHSGLASISPELILDRCCRSAFHRRNIAGNLFVFAYVNLTEQVVSESFARKWARGPRTMKQSVQMMMRRHAANFGCGSVSQSPEPLWRARHRPVLLRPRAWQRFVSIPGEAILDRDLIAGCCALAASRADATSFA